MSPIQPTNFKSIRCLVLIRIFHSKAVNPRSTATVNRMTTTHFNYSQSLKVTCSRVQFFFVQIISSWLVSMTLTHIFFYFNRIHGKYSLITMITDFQHSYRINTIIIISVIAFFFASDMFCVEKILRIFFYLKSYSILSQVCSLNTYTYIIIQKVDLMCSNLKPICRCVF